jgi:hypothetical protein
MFRKKINPLLNVNENNFIVKWYNIIYESKCRDKLIKSAEKDKDFKIINNLILKRIIYRRGNISKILKIIIRKIYRHVNKKFANQIKSRDLDIPMKKMLKKPKNPENIKLPDNIFSQKGTVISDLDWVNYEMLMLEEDIENIFWVNLKFIYKRFNINKEKNRKYIEDQLLDILKTVHKNFGSVDKVNSINYINIFIAFIILSIFSFAVYFIGSVISLIILISLKKYHTIDINWKNIFQSIIFSWGYLIFIIVKILKRRSIYTNTNTNTNEYTHSKE